VFPGQNGSEFTVVAFTSLLGEQGGIAWRIATDIAELNSTIDQFWGVHILSRAERAGHS
jgi:hypothetical protein